MRLRVAALSYYHARRPFAVRIDASAAPGSPAVDCFACSHPVRGVARLPAESKSAARPSATTPSVITAAGSPPCAAPDSSRAAITVPQYPTQLCAPVAVVEEDDEDEESFDTDDESMAMDDAESCNMSHLAQWPLAQPPSSFTYTSGTDLADELRVQGDMLQRVSAQQHFILEELTRMRSSRGMPPPPSMPPPPTQDVRIRATMVA